jgi:ribosome-associated protein
MPRRHRKHSDYYTFKPAVDGDSDFPESATEKELDDDKLNIELNSLASEKASNHFNIRNLDPAFIDETGRPNKSALKRYSNELQALGEALIALPQAEFDELAMPDILRDAVAIARRITQHGGLYRQKQLIGKLMRKFDTSAIRAALQAKQDAQRSATREFHRIEQWRNRLIEEPHAVNEFIAHCPQVDRQRLSSLIDHARHEQLLGRSASTRELFGFVRQTLAQPLSQQRIINPINPIDAAPKNTPDKTAPPKTGSKRKPTRKQPARAIAPKSAKKSVQKPAKNSRKKSAKKSLKKSLRGKAKPKAAK